MSINTASCLFVRLIPFLVIVDIINGYFLNKGMDSSLGVCVKAVILLLSISILMVSTKYRGILGFTFIYVPFFLLTVLLNTDSPIAPTINHLLKFVTVVYVYYAAVFLFRTNKISQKKIVMAFYVNTFLLVVNIYSGLLGVGYYAYGDMLGCKGFMYAHNEMSGMEAVLFGTSYFFFYQRYTNKKFVLIIVNIVFLMAALLVSTKAGILLVIVDLLLVPWAFKKSKGIITSFIKTSKIKIIVLLSIIGIMVYYGYALLEYSGAIDRWTYFFDKDGTDAIYSSRDLFWEEEKYEWIDGNIAVKLFGLGGNRSVEMDQADTLLNYGLMGIVLVYSFYFSLVVKAFHYRNRSVYAKYLWLLNICILASSCFAGHLLFSGLMGIHFALMNAFLYSRDILSNRINSYEGEKCIN